MDSYRQFREARYFGSLDALRCIAIIAVIWQHFPPISHAAMPFTNAGATGVGLFFSLSGFLITTLLLREEAATGRISLRGFYLRRSLRIFPLYYAVLSAYLILVLLREHNAAGRLFFSNLPYYLTYTNNWFVDLIVNEDGQRRVLFIFAWSLATEEQFYLFWPLLMRYAKRSVAISVLVAGMVIDLALEMAFGSGDVPRNAMERLLRIATSPSTQICCGVLLALALHSTTGFARLWRILGQRWSAPTMALVALAVTLWPGGVSPLWHLSLSGIFAALVGSSVIREDHGLAWLLTNKALARIGVVSYGIYMLHMLAVNAVKLSLPALGLNSGVVAFAMAVLLAYAMAELSFRLYETPILRLKRRLSSSHDMKPREPL